MKDRIRKVMESLHMTQQVFADFISIAPATLSSVFNGRTRPTLNIIEAIKNKIPTISTDWLLFGVGAMYVSESDTPNASDPNMASHESEPLLDFAETAPVAPSGMGAVSTPKATSFPGEKTDVNVVKYIDKPQRKITEIRLFYDDQTWETFVPKKS